MAGLVFHHQGSLDGLCGMYAIVHAFQLFHVDDELSFRAACGALAKSRWPAVLWGGTTLGDMKRMIAGVIRAADRPDIRVRYPFQRKPPRTLADFLSELKGQFEDDNVTCAIVGFQKPEHWTVIRYDQGRVYFWDSTANQETFRKNPSSLKASKRAAGKGHWVPDRSEVILLSS